MRAAGAGPRARERTAPREQDLVALAGSQEGQVHDRAARVGDGGFQQDREVAQHAAGGGGVEQIGVVLEREDERIAHLAGPEIEVELRGSLLPGDGLQEVAPEAHSLPLPSQRQRDESTLFRPSRAQQREHHLEQRGAAGIAIDLQLFHQSRKGVFLVLEGLQGGLLDPVQKAGEARPAGEVRAQHDRIDGIAGRRGERRPTGGGDPDDHVLQGGIAVQQGHESGQESRGQGGAAGAGHLGDMLGQRRAQRRGDTPPGIALDGRTRPVGGEIEHRERSPQPPAPILPEPFPFGPRQPLRLPVDMIDVGEGDRRQPQLRAGAFAGVEDGQLAGQQRHRPKVGDDVVDREQEAILDGRVPPQPGAYQRPRLEIERPVGFEVHEFLQLLLAATGCVGFKDLRLATAADPLPRLPLDLTERGAQHGMAPGERAQSPLEGGGIEGWRHPGRRGDVVGAAFRREPVDHPQSPLAIRKRRIRLGQGGARHRLGEVHPAA